MNSVITVRNIDRGDKIWLAREARHRGISMEELVRRLIREKREKSERRETPSQAFGRYFGPEHGIELPLTQRYGYKPTPLPDEGHL